MPLRTVASDLHDNHNNCYEERLLCMLTPCLFITNAYDHGNKFVLRVCSYALKLIQGAQSIDDLLIWLQSLYTLLQWCFSTVHIYIVIIGFFNYACTFMP